MQHYEYVCEWTNDTKSVSSIANFLAYWTNTQFIWNLSLQLK